MNYKLLPLTVSIISGIITMFVIILTRTASINIMSFDLFLTGLFTIALFSVFSSLYFLFEQRQWKKDSFPSAIRSALVNLLIWGIGLFIYTVASFAVFSESIVLNVPAILSLVFLITGLITSIILSGVVLATPLFFQSNK